MINLLPTDEKQELQYARRNTGLLKWVMVLALSLAGVVVIVFAGNIYIQLSIKNYSSDVARAQENLQAQKIEETQAEIEEISNSTKLATQVLSREVLFSKLLRQLGASIPPNSVLQQFQIEELGGGLTLQAAATDINAATQLQVNLEDPRNKIFERADIENINCGAEDTQYPCTIQLRALFAKDNPYTLTGQSGDSQ
jgi:Tfp pilus assembly protein PilN